jgi:hypothetical protein
MSTLRAHMGSRGLFDDVFPPSEWPTRVIGVDTGLRFAFGKGRRGHMVRVFGLDGH